MENQVFPDLVHTIFFAICRINARGYIDINAFQDHAQTIFLFSCHRDFKSYMVIKLPPPPKCPNTM